MRDTRLIFVEGLPGLGKSTTAEWLARKLYSEGLPVHLYLEHQPEHPLNVGGDSHPAGDVPGEAFFRQYTPHSFLQESLDRWQAYLQETAVTRTIDVFDSYPFQNSVRVLLQLNASMDMIEAYADRVESLASPLRPILVYFQHKDTAQTLSHFQEISKKRGEQWTAYVEALITNCPYAVARNLTGASGAARFMLDYKQAIDSLLIRSQLPRVILEGCFGDWDECYRQIGIFLEL